MNSNKESRIAQFADMLENALNERVSIEALSSTDSTLDLDDAYAIQMRNVARAQARGATISGKKIGLTSSAMQEMLGVHEPDFGHLFSFMDITGKPIPMDTLLQPKVEGEIAFVLKEDIAGPHATAEDVINATDYVVAALEIVDSRVRDWKIKLVDTVSDNASSGLYVLGSQKVKLTAISLPHEPMKLYRNGKLINEGTGADIMGDPANCVAWLANKMGQYGVVLKKGEVVLSGALSAAVSAQRGDRFEAVFAGLGTVATAFV